MSLETYRQSIREGKRDAIVAAAQRVFLDRGYQGAAMASIAKAADVSTATLYKHYANKETLFEAVVADRIRSFDTALATGLATTFVLALAAVTSHTLYHYLLLPLQLAYLNIIVFIIVIAGLVQVIQLYLKATSPILHQVLGVYLPLITSNCAVLGVTLLAINQELTLLATFVFAVGAAAGFTLVMVLFGALREQLEQSNLPDAFAGTPIALLSAGLMSLAFMGFQGIGS